MSRTSGWPATSVSLCEQYSWCCNSTSGQQMGSLIINNFVCKKFGIPACQWLLTDHFCSQDVQATITWIPMWTPNKRSIFLTFAEYLLTLSKILLYAIYWLVVKMFLCRLDSIREFGGTFVRLVAILLNQASLQVCPSLQLASHNMTMTRPESQYPWFCPGIR